MSYDVGVACRASSGFVTDGAGFTYCLADTYPTTRSSITFGWNSGGGSTTRDRDNTVYAEIAGTNRANNASDVFSLDLPASGAAVIHIALGDVASNFATLPTKVVLKDGSTTIATLQNNSDANTGTLMDATGALITTANWVANEVGISYTFVGTTLTLNFDGAYTSGGAGNTLCYVRVVQAAAGSVGDPYFYRNIAGG